MKKTIIILLSVLMLSFVASCSSSATAPQMNTISVATLTEEQQEILDLFSIPTGQELLIFDFITDEPFNQLEVWVEVYEYGVLVDRPAGLVVVTDTEETRGGRLAVTINKNENVFQWTLSKVENGSRSSHIGTTEIAENSGLGRAFGPMDSPAKIEPGKEIIIYSSTFQTVSTPHHAFDTQTLQEQPELLAEFPYAHIIIVRFS
jgi:hypothetical protein